MPRLHQRMLVIACALFAIATPTGCAIWPFGETLPTPPAPEPLQIADGLENELDDAIARAIPDVSFETTNPEFSEPLGRHDPSVILPRIETLNGEAKIVCRKSAEHVFGRCAFPPPAAP